VNNWKGGVAKVGPAAAKSGFKGLADFIRTAVLDRVLFSR
jgi:hypothetical protein